MSAAEMHAFVEHKLGPMRRFVEREIGVLVDCLRPGEQLETVGVGIRGMLQRGTCLVAATDQRLLLVWTSSGCQELEYGSLVSVTDDASAGEIALVTREEVHTLRIAPPPRAAEIVAAVAARVGDDRIHPAAGAAQARRMRKALTGAVVSVCVFIGGYVVAGALQGGADGGHAAGPASRHYSKGQCLDGLGRTRACTSAGAMFIVLGAAGGRRCPASSPTYVKAIARTPEEGRELSRWCIGIHGLEGDRP